jgi:4-hydroxyphenylpyruvate dioxygenase-like putative hemolysin
VFLHRRPELCLAALAAPALAIVAVLGGDEDPVARGVGVAVLDAAVALDHLPAEERAAAEALNEVEVRVDLVGAIDGEVDLLVNPVEVEAGVRAAR